MVSMKNIKGQKILLTSSYTLLIIAVVLAAGLGGSLVALNFFDEGAETPEVVITSLCNNFASPTGAKGMPVRVSELSTSFLITMSDGYVLHLNNLPSLFLNQRGLFQIQENTVVAYVPIADEETFANTSACAALVEAPTPEPETPEEDVEE